MKNSISIVIKTGSFPAVSETFIVSNIVCAIKRGFQVNIIAPNKIQECATSQPQLLTQYQLLEKTKYFKSPVKSYKRILFAVYCLLNPLVFFYFLKYSWNYRIVHLKTLYRIYYYLPYRKADICHVHFANNAGELPALKKIGYIKSKLLITFHGHDAFYANAKQQRKLKHNYNLLFKYADRITVNSIYLKKLVLNLGCPEFKLRVVPVGVDVNLFSPEFLPKILDISQPIQLLSVGRLVEIKGHEFGIRAVRVLIERGFSVKYTIIGEGALMQKLKALTVEIGVEDHVNFFGGGSQMDIRKAYTKSHFFLMTSVMDASGREESQGVVTAEAQAMGLPIVGFKSGGVPFTISDETGILVKQKDFEALANAISSLISLPKTYETMSVSARKWILDNFNLDTMVAHYYEDLISK